MKKRRSEPLYNILLPIWLLVWVPSFLWLLLIPANYLIDRLVLRWSLRDVEDRDGLCRRHCWKVCLAGFLSDFVGGLLLLGISLFSDSLSNSELLDKAIFGIQFNPFENVLSFVIVALAVALSGWCIYQLDRWILKRAGLSLEQARFSALRLALLTAPYLYLFPSGLLYQ